MLLFLSIFVLCVSLCPRCARLRGGEIGLSVAGSGSPGWVAGSTDSGLGMLAIISATEIWSEIVSIGVVGSCWKLSATSSSSIKSSIFSSFSSIGVCCLRALTIRNSRTNSL